jgi:glyoxylase-like metal-dependent hydrolase (beta-lactamase superfamily II)
VDRADDHLDYPFPEPPAFGRTMDVAPGVKWLRLPLPYRLDHVNIYLLDDGDGWAALDTGLDTPDCRAAWEAALAGPLAGQKLTRLIVTHFHPDHVGLVGWLSRRFDLPLWMPRPEYLFSLALQYAPGDLGAEMNRRFYLSHGLPPSVVEAVLVRGHEYLRHTTGVPTTYRRLQAGQVLPVGARSPTVLTGGGHALEQAMLLSAGEKLFFAADQVIARISPNVSVFAMEPQADALGAYLSSLASLRKTVADDVLVLPGHGLPFRGLHARIDALFAHHAHRCAAIAEACRAEPRSAADLIAVVFHRVLDEHQTGFAFGETLAHVNRMLAAGELAREIDAAGHERYRTV